MKTKILIFTIMTLFIIVSCGKKQENTANQEQKQTQQQLQQQSGQITPEQKKEDSIKAASETQEKEQKVKEALEEERILNDTLGQWAISAEASSTYAGDNKDKNAPYSPNQATGKPDVNDYSDNGKAWTPQEPDKGIEWIKLNYSKPVNATEIRIRQTFNPGSIIKVELIDVNGKSHTVWEGVDSTKYEANKIQYLKVKFNKTDYKTDTIKITLATNTGPGWKEIDAVQLVGDDNKSTTK